MFSWTGSVEQFEVHFAVARICRRVRRFSPRQGRASSAVRLRLPFLGDEVLKKSEDEQATPGAECSQARMNAVPRLRSSDSRIFKATSTQNQHIKRRRTNRPTEPGTL